MQGSPPRGRPLPQDGASSSGQFANELPMLGSSTLFYPPGAAQGQVRREAAFPGLLPPMPMKMIAGVRALRGGGNECLKRRPPFALPLFVLQGLSQQQLQGQQGPAGRLGGLPPGPENSAFWRGARSKPNAFAGSVHAALGDMMEMVSSGGASTQVFNTFNGSKSSGVSPARTVGHRTANISQEELPMGGIGAMGSFSAEASPRPTSQVRAEGGGGWGGEGSREEAVEPKVARGVQLGGLST